MYNQEIMSLRELKSALLWSVESEIGLCAGSRRFRLEARRPMI